MANVPSAAGRLVMAGGASSVGTGLPFLPFIEAMGSALPGAQPSFDRLHWFDEVAARLYQEAEGGGLVLVLEDLHWADASSCELLDFLRRRLKVSRLMLLVTYRTEEVDRQHPLSELLASWRRHDAAQVIELQSLSGEQVGEMVDAILGQPVGPFECRQPTASRMSSGILSSRAARAVTSRSISGRSRIPATRQPISAPGMPGSNSMQTKDRRRPSWAGRLSYEPHRQMTRSATARANHQGFANSLRDRRSLLPASLERQAAAVTRRQLRPGSAPQLGEKQPSIRSAGSLSAQTRRSRPPRPPHELRRLR